MGGKLRGLGHALQEHRLALASAAQGGSVRAGSLVHGREIAATLSIDMPLTEYERRFDLRYAKGVRELLHGLADERAKRTGTLPKKAFRDVREALLSRFKLGEHGVLYLLASAWIRKARPATLEDALAFVNGFLARTGLDQLPESRRFHATWMAWDGFLYLLWLHMPCVREGDLRPDTVLRTLELWSTTGAHVAPCHAFRVIDAAERSGLDAEVVAALAREHGAERLDDIAQLIEGGTITAETIWELKSRPELVRALTLGQIEWLMREWRAGQPNDLLAFAQSRRRELRRQRVELFAGTRPKPLLAESILKAIDLVYREANEGERAGNDVLWKLELHQTACGKKSWEPGGYVPSDDTVLGSTFECHSALRDGLARRLSLEGDELEERAERVCRILGGTAVDRTLFALDLLCLWDGSVDPALCQRASVAAMRARIPNSFALDLFAQFGQKHAEEAVGLVEDGLIGLKECQRLLRNPVILVEFQGRMRDLLERYRNAGSPTDLYTFAHGRSTARDALGRKPARTKPAVWIKMRHDDALHSPARYLAAIDAAETRPKNATPEPEANAEAVSEPSTGSNPCVVTEPDPVDVREETPAHNVPITVSPVPDVPPDEGPLLRTMREIGDNLAVDAVKRAWDWLTSTFPADRRTEIITALEPILTRMVHAESRAHSKRKVNREDCYNNVIHGSFFDRGVGTDDMALSTLLSFEKIGLTFPTHQEFRTFYTGISARIGHTVGLPFFGDEQLVSLNFLCEHLRVHLPHLSADHRAAMGSAETLLAGIDLFAEGGGKAPLCKCLRLAVDLRRRQVGRKESFWLFRTFTTERVDDLIALLESRKVRTRSLDRLFQQPNTVAEHPLDDLVNLLAA